MLRVSTFDESSVYFMSIFCSSKSNLIYTLLCPLCLPIKSIILDSWVVSPSMLTSNLYTYLQQFIQRINQSFLPKCPYTCSYNSSFYIKCRAAIKKNPSKNYHTDSIHQKYVSGTHRQLHVWFSRSNKKRICQLNK